MHGYERPSEYSVSSDIPSREPLEDMPQGGLSDADQLYAYKQARKSSTLDPQDDLADIEADNISGLYFRETRRTELLTAKEEQEIVQTIVKGKKAIEKLALLSEQGRLTPQKRDQLAQKITQGHEAQNHLISANTRLVGSIAMKYIGKGMELADMISEGNVGLIHALQKFDPRRGLRFSTYATWWIMQGITRGLHSKGRAIPLPANMNVKITQLKRMEGHLTQTLQRKPTTSELAQALDRTVEEVLFEEHAYSQIPFSLEEPLSEDEDSEFGFFVIDETQENPEDMIDAHILETRLKQLLPHLEFTQAKLLDRLFGLTTGEAMPMQQACNSLSIHRDEGRQILAKTLKSLRYKLLFT
jgi:RNA polymerase primary sigma factor